MIAGVPSMSAHTRGTQEVDGIIIPLTPLTEAEESCLDYDVFRAKQHEWCYEFQDPFEEYTLGASVPETDLLRMLQTITERNLWPYMRVSPEEHAMQFAVSGGKEGLYLRAIEYMVSRVGVDPDLEPDTRFFGGGTLNTILQGFGHQTYPAKEPRKSVLGRYGKLHPPVC